MPPYILYHYIMANYISFYVLKEIFTTKYIYSSLYTIYNMAENRISLPSSSGGLVRYFDEYKSNIEIKPGYIVALIILVLIVELILYSQSARLLG